MEKQKGQTEEYVKITWNKNQGRWILYFILWYFSDELTNDGYRRTYKDNTPTQLLRKTLDKSLKPERYTPPNSTAGAKAARSAFQLVSLYLFGRREDDPWKITFGESWTPRCWFFSICWWLHKNKCRVKGNMLLCVHSETVKATPKPIFYAQKPTVTKPEISTVIKYAIRFYKYSVD